MYPLHVCLQEEMGLVKRKVVFEHAKNVLIITKACLYNFDPLIPHFYIVKLGFIGVDNIFLISAKKIDCEYSLEPPRRGGSNEYHNLCFE